MKMTYLLWCSIVAANRCFKALYKLTKWTAFLHLVTTELFLSKYYQVPNTHCTALISITKVTKEEDEALGTKSLPKIKGHKTYSNNLKKKSMRMINTNSVQ